MRTSKSYGVLDYSRVRATVLTSLYSPWGTWQDLATALADLGGPNRDPERMWALTEFPTFRCSGCSSSKTSLGEEDQRELQFDFREALIAIICSDGVDVFPDLASAKNHFVVFSQKSEWADVWGSIPLSCAGWPKTKKGFQGPVEGKTNFPVLFVGNTAGEFASPFVIDS